MPSDNVIRRRSIRADLYAKYFVNKDIMSFWDSIRKTSNTRILLASIIDNCICEEYIAHSGKTIITVF